MYTIVIIIKVKRVAEKKMHLKNASTVLIVVLNLLLGKLCCFVVKLNKLKVRCQWKDNCKLRYFKMCIILRYPIAFYSKLNKKVPAEWYVLNIPLIIIKREQTIHVYLKSTFTLN